MASPTSASPERALRKGTLADRTESLLDPPALQGNKQRMRISWCFVFFFFLYLLFLPTLFSFTMSFFIPFFHFHLLCFIYFLSWFFLQFLTSLIPPLPQLLVSQRFFSELLVLSLIPLYYHLLSYYLSLPPYILNFLVFHLLFLFLITFHLQLLLSFTHS